MDVLNKVTELNTNEIISAFLLNNWILISIGFSILFFLAYVAYSDSKNDDRFVKIFTDKLKKVWNFIGMKGFNK